MAYKHTLLEPDKTAGGLLRSISLGVVIIKLATLQVRQLPIRVGVYANAMILARTGFGI
jgi:hypothetical protein